MVNLFRHAERRPAAAAVLNVLRQKCEHKGIAIPTFESLLPHRQILDVTWPQMLGHQLPVLPPLEEFWNALPEIFTWLMSGQVLSQPAVLHPSATETVVRTRVLPLGVPFQSRSALEAIRFAAANHLCVDLRYDGGVRRIEPYSLRQTAEGNLVLHAIRSDSREHRTYRVDRIQGATVTQQSFAPQYAVELTDTGSLHVGLSTVAPRMRQPQIRRQRNTSSGPTYVYRCSACGKTFNKKKMNPTLNRHKNKNGYPCYGRYGSYVRTKY